MSEIESVDFSVQVRIVRLEGGGASITVPAELRLTPKVLRYISDALNERGLTLKHMDIAEQHKLELESLPNVVLKDNKLELESPDDVDLQDKEDR